MRITKLPALLLLASVPLAFNSAQASAQPDEALVSRYEADRKQLEAKLAECKMKPDIAAVMADVSCMSAQKVINKRHQRMLASKCSSSDTFVYVPPGLSGKERASYLEQHAPSEKVLRACGQTKETWLHSYMK